MKYDNSEIVHKKVGNIQFLQFKALLQYSKDINHCFTLKYGGISKDMYSSLNLGLNVSDNIDNVKKNYINVCNTLNFEYSNLFRGVQTHSDKVVFVDKTNCGTVSKDIEVECDGSITNIPKIPLVTNSADCMTVLIYDSLNRYIASIHSGWQGVANRIVVKAIDILVSKYGSKKENIIVCVAPSICKNCFEVMDDVKQIFENSFSYSNIVFKKDDTHYLIDLEQILKYELLGVGVLEKNIHFSGICNKCNSNDFYSFRKDRITGRMGCFIELK